MNKKKTLTPTPLSYFSACSGMEAATVAWEHLGWKCEGLCDFASFPQKVLKHLYPEVPFYSNMLNLLDNEEFKKTNFDVFVAGTPCQAWSNSGLRKGMDDLRAQLAIKYGTILDAKSPKYNVWENVDSVFDKKHKEGLCNIISSFTGVDFRPDQINRGGGVVQGTKRSIAYRVFDSQYFGVPQRRKRVYIVGYRGTDWRVPAAILFDEGCFKKFKKETIKEQLLLKSV